MNPAAVFPHFVKFHLCVAFFGISLNLSIAQIVDDTGKSKAYTKFVEANGTLQEALRGRDSMWIAECYYVVGKRYIGLNNYFKAKQFLHRALSIREPRGPSEEIVRTYLRLIECEFYEKQNGSLDSAILYTNRAMRYSLLSKTHFGLMNAYRIRGELHAYAWRTKKSSSIYPFNPSLDSAQHYYNKALRMASALQKKMDIALCFDLMGNTFYDQQQIAEGIRSEKQAISFYNQAERPNATVEPSVEVAKGYLRLGNLKRAKKWLDRSKYLSDSCQWGTYDYFTLLALTYAQYYTLTGDLGKAMEYQQAGYEQRLKAEKLYRKAAIEGLVAAQENEEKEFRLVAQKRELDIQQQKAKMQYWVVVLSILLLLLVCIIAFLLHRLYKKYKIKSHRNEHLFLEQSHRIKNNLQTISDLLQLQLGTLMEPQAIQALEESVLRVDAMSYIHKRLFGKHRSVEIEVSEYVEDLVDSVLKTYTLAHTVVEFKVEKLLLHVDKAILMGLIVNELATNACKYALSKNPSPQLLIECYERNEHVVLAFQDNGPGFDAQSVGSSFGLELIQIWVHNLAGESSFTFGNGTRFTLSFEKQVETYRRSESELNAVS